MGLRAAGTAALLATTVGALVTSVAGIAKVATMTGMEGLVVVAGREIPMGTAGLVSSLDGLAIATALHHKEHPSTGTRVTMAVLVLASMAAQATGIVLEGLKATPAPWPVTLLTFAAVVHMIPPAAAWRGFELWVDTRPAAPPAPVPNGSAGASQVAADPAVLPPPASLTEEPAPAGAQEAQQGASPAEPERAAPGLVLVPDPGRAPLTEDELVAEISRQLGEDASGRGCQRAHKTVTGRGCGSTRGLELADRVRAYRESMEQVAQ